MKCRGCEYALWNLPGRTCPECGRPFLPGEFEFVANSVRFMCPHCGQAYYGTDAKGHLVPREFDCVRCAAHIHMDQMVLLPTAGVEESQTAPQRLPWTERSERGFVRAWLGTILMAVTSPTRLIRAARDVRPASAWWFATVTYLVALLGGVSPFLVFFFAQPGRVRPAGLVSSIGGPLLVVSMLWLGIVAVWGLLAHAILRITGRTAGGPGRTYVALCFSSAVTILGVVPCFGLHMMGLIVPLWWAILAALMLREEHKVPAWRATVAGVLPPVLGYMSVVGLWILLVTNAMARVTMATSAAQRAQAAAAAQQAQAAGVASRSARAVTTGVLLWGSTNGAASGAGPAHAAELLSMGLVQPGDVVVTAQTGTSPWDVSVGPMTLARFEDSSEAERIEAASVAALRQPAGTIAHRLGDFVFTYHGIDLRGRDQRLWLVVFSPDPGSTPPRPGREINLVVGLGDGTIVELTPESFGEAVARQNTVRAEYGLAPLPDPRTVTEDTPVTGP